MSPSPHRFAGILIFAGLLACLATPPAGAQTLPLEQRGYEPVDQTVEDVDPLRRSLRRVEMGLRNIGQESRVYRRPNSDDPDKLYYISQGIVAEFDRSQYARLRDGTLLQMIPPNTVFHIGLPPAEPGESAAPPPDHPLRVDARVRRRVGSDSVNVADARRATADPAGARAPSAASGRPRADRTDWATYRRFLQAQRRSTMRAIRQATADSP